MKTITNALNVVNEFYAILTDRRGQGLAEIITSDASFHGPFVSASGAGEFLAGMQKWVPLKKTYRIRKQFVDEDDVCSIYTIEVTAPSGAVVHLETADWIQVREGKIACVNVFFDPREWARAIGHA